MSVRATYKIRVPKTIHQLLYRLALRTDKSINGLVVILLDSGIANERSAGLKELNLRKGEPEMRPNPFSGRWVQTMPIPLHDRIFAAAKEEGVSINLLINTLLCRELGWLERNLAIDR